MARAETTFGAQLRRQRLAAALSQEALAERAGISADTVRALERGRHGAPQSETLARLAAALGLTTAERAALVAAARSAGDPHPSGERQVAPVAQAALHNLPAPVSALVGREREQEAVLALLTSARLVTLTGTGGVGKTRLALAVGSAAVARCRDGVWLVEMASLADPALVPGAVAAVLGVREEPGVPPLATLIAALRGRELLLLLDNCEHLVAACAALAKALLAACPGLRLLATSREALDLAGEQRYRVPSLSTPDPQHLPAAELAGSFEAVRLFVARARERVPSFALEGPWARAVMEVCARLEGIPLAIELAAAWVGLLPAEGLVARLGDHLNLLTKGTRTAPSRQQTLRATLDWSWNLLAAPHQLLLARLAVFAGGWTLPAAQQVCGTPGQGEWALLPGLAALEERSLLGRDDHVPGAGPAGEGRYRLLETVRQYAAERLAALGEEAATRDRHLACYLGLAEEAAPALAGPEQGAWLARLEAEHDNVRAALRWSQERGDLQAGLRLAGAVWWFWAVRGHLSEGRGWLERLLTAGAPGATGEGRAVRAVALGAAGELAYRQSDDAQAAALQEEALALWRELGDRQGIAASLNSLGSIALQHSESGWAAALQEEALALWRELGDRQGIARSLHVLGVVAERQGEYGRAAALQEEALALRRELGDRQGIATSLQGMASLVVQLGEYGRGATMQEEALALFRELGDRQGVAYTLLNLGIVAYWRGEVQEAVTLHEECVALARELGDRRHCAMALTYLGHCASRLGDATTATTHYQEALRLCHATGDRYLLPYALEGWGWATRGHGGYARAARLYGIAEALRAMTGAAPAPHNRRDRDEKLGALREALGEEEFEAALAAGRALPLEEALALALAEGADPIA